MKINRAAFSKFCYYTLAAFLLVAALLLLIQKNIKWFDSNRVALVDVVENNYIFRGNNLFVAKNGDAVFAHDELTSSLNKILQQQGHKELDDYYLIDISLLDFDQYFTIEKEKLFFTQHPNQGEIINFSTLSPSLLLDLGMVTKSYNLWLTKNLEKIHELASQKMDKPIVVYIHCDSGRDRTGFIVANYRLLFNDMPLKKVRAQNASEAGRNSVFLYDRAIRSYCLHVKKFYNKTSEYCAE
jgi:hypothetical protein